MQHNTQERYFMGLRGLCFRNKGDCTPTINAFDNSIQGESITLRIEMWLGEQEFSIKWDLEYISWD